MRRRRMTRGGSLEAAEAGMAEMSAKFRAGGGVVEVKLP
jgi:phosphomethylpyrimidine synthase